jgi:phosphatidylglycerol:prolipoprotein diacylglycerol transferase
MVALGFLSGILLSAFIAKKEEFPPEKIIDLSIYVLISAIVGARTFYVIQFWHQFKHNPIEIISVQHGGLVFFGGLIAALLIIFLYTKIQKINLWKLFDIITPGTMLGYAIGRIGCFLNGCCFGFEAKVPWALHYPYLSGLHHPTQLYASAAMFIGFLIILYIRKYHRKFPGQIFFSGILLYSIYRFTNEFFREGPRYLFNLTLSQWIAISLFTWASYALWKGSVRIHPDTQK